MSSHQTQPPQNDAGKAAYGVGPSASQLVGGRIPSRLHPYRGREPHLASAGHTRFVMMMKVMLPLVAAALVGLILVWPYFSDEAGFTIGFTSLNLSGTEQAGMDNALYVGVDERRRPYSISADIARLVENRPNTVNLEMPKADVTLRNGAWLVMTSETGRFIQDEQILELAGGVNLFHDSGYEINTATLSVDLTKVTAVGNDPVEGQGPFGELKAEGVRIENSGATIYFTGKSNLLLHPSRGDTSFFTGAP